MLVTLYMRTDRQVTKVKETCSEILEGCCRAMTKQGCLFARYELMWNIGRRNE